MTLRQKLIRILVQCGVVAVALGAILAASCDTRDPVTIPTHETPSTRATAGNPPFTHPDAGTHDGGL